METPSTTSLDALMTARGLKNRELATLIGSTETGVSKWRRGLKPGKRYREKIIAAMELTEAAVGALGWKEEARV
jgi:hypothetical protein